MYLCIYIYIGLHALAPDGGPHEPVHLQPQDGPTIMINQYTAIHKQTDV